VTASTTLPPVVLVGLGGAAGAAARYLLGTRVATPGRATLAVNVLGSLVLGVLVGGGVGGPLALAVGTGFCGAFTTFSSFAVETSEEYTAAGTRPAAWLAGLHLAGALAAVALGALLGASLL
jgi:CrcB protein